MRQVVLDLENSLNVPRPKTSSSSCYSTKLSICLSLISLSVVLLLFQIQASNTPLSFSSSSSSWASFHQWGQKVLNTKLNLNCSQELEAMVSKLRDSVFFLPLKDLRFAKTPMEGNTWFMSSLEDMSDDEASGYLYFPSEASKGRLLCLVGHDMHDGTLNKYALAWTEGLPNNATLRHGLTYVSDTYYDYTNLWHGLSSLLPFVGWYKTKGCEVPDRWILYHWGELRDSTGAWVRNVMEATFGRVQLEGFEVAGDGPTCFEKAVVFRHDKEGRNTRKRLEEFDLLRCKARAFCNVNQDTKVEEGVPVIRLTLLLRTGARAFKNESAVVGIFERACQTVEGCRFTVARSDNLTFCDQVNLLSSTDILASAHGAQMTNLIFMERNSSIMEFFPKGWLEHAGAGQYVFHWLASWSGMTHGGTWRDTEGDECPHPQQDQQCFWFYKDGKIGHNETFLKHWTMEVLDQVKQSKLDGGSGSSIQPSTCECA